MTLPTPHPSAREVAEQFVADAAFGRWEAAASRFHDEAVIEHRLALAGPAREEGIDQIVAHLRQAEASPFELSGSRTVVYETADPQVAIAEIEYTVTRPDGTPTTLPLIQVFTVVGGRIALIRDYHNEALVAHRAGEFDAFVALIKNRPTTGTSER